MTASVVAMEASAEKKETFRHNKRRRTTTTTTSNNNNNNNNILEEEDDDDLDVTCDETTRSLPAKRKHLLRGGAHAKGLVEGKKTSLSNFFFQKFKNVSLSLSLSLYTYIYIFILKTTTFKTDRRQNQPLRHANDNRERKGNEGTKRGRRSKRRREEE